MGKLKGKRKASKAKPRQKRKANLSVSRAPKRKRNSKKKSSSTNKRSNSKSGKPSGPEQKVKRTIRGFGSTIHVMESKRAGKDIKIIRRTGRFNPEIKVGRSSKGLLNIKRRMWPAAKRYFNSIGDSKNSLYYFRILYTFEQNKILIFSHFSVGITQCKNVEQFKIYFVRTCNSFHKSLKKYALRGISDIRISDIIVQGYKK